MLYFDDEGNLRTTEDNGGETADIAPTAPAVESNPSPVFSPQHPRPSTTPQHPAASSETSPLAALAGDIPADESPGFLDYTTDVPKGVYNGVVGAVQETGQFLWDVADTGVNFFTGESLGDKMPGYDSLGSFKAHTQTQVGKVTESVAQVVTGLIGVGKIIKAAGVLQKSGTIAKSLLTGAVADAVVMAPLEQRLSNLVESYPELANPLTAALAAKPDDTRWEGRLKNAVEGMGLGLAFEGLLMGCATALRAVKSGDHAALEKILPKVEAGAQEARKATSEAPPLKPKPLGAHGGHATEGASPTPPGGRSALVTEEDVKAIAARAAVSTKSVDEMLVKGPEVLNTHRLSITDEKGLALHEALADQLFPRTTLGKGRQTMDEMTGKNMERLRETGMDTTKLDAQLGRVDASSAAGQQLRKEIYRLRSAYDTALQEFRDLGTKLLQYGGTEQEVARHQILGKMAGELYISVKNAGTEAGRTLASFRQITENFADILKAGDDKLLEKAIKTHSKTSRITNSDKWLKMLQDSRFAEMAGDPRALSALAEGLQSKRFSDYFTEWYINFILSGVRTQATNIGSNAGKAIMTPSARCLGRAMEFNAAAVGQEALAFKALARNAGTSLRFALKAFKEDRTILEGGGAQWLEGVSATTKAWSAANVRGRYTMAQLNNGASLQQAMDVPQWKEIQASIFEAAGGVINLPGRFLKTGDEFFKQLAYRSELETRFMMEAMEQYPTATTKEWAIIAAKRVEDTISPSGRGLDKDGIRQAKRQTWTQDLPQNSTSRGVQIFANSHPLLKMVLPFIRTPSNLVADAFDHIPIVARMAERNREALRAGGREAARVKGQEALGGLMITTFAILAADGTITGSAPSDPAAREQLRQMGWQESSIRLGDTYVSLNRADPFALLLTATANFVNASQHLDDGAYGEMAATLMASTLRLIGDKSYMKSLGDLVDFLHGDEYALKRVTQGIVSGFVVPNLIREVSTGYDDIRRDIHTVESRILSSVPGFSKNLPAKHDWLTGKPVAGGLTHFFGLSPINEDVVARELATLGGVYKGLPYEFNKVQLTEAQHSRYSELMGTIKVDGKNLHQTLNSVIHSKEYDLGRSGSLADKDRAAYLNKIITAYRKVAGQVLLQENPDFQAQAIEEDRVKKKKPQLPVKLPAPSRRSRSSGQPQPSGATIRQQQGADALTALIQ